MKKTKISLDRFIELTSKAVKDANEKILTDYLSVSKEKTRGGTSVNAPLLISKMKVSFSAAVDASDFKNDDVNELKLDFGRQGSFCGEFEIVVV